MGNDLKFDMWSPEYQQDLYRIYETLRDDYPVYKYEIEGTGARNCWILSRYEDVLPAIRDKDRFRNAGTRNDLIPQLQSSDGDLHKDLRSQVFPRMSAAAVEGLVPLVEDTVSDVLDAVETRGGCELTREVAFAIPRRVVPVFLGFPEEFTERMIALVDPLAGYDPQDPVFPDAALGDKLVTLVEDMVACKRGKPGGDLVSQLLVLEDAGKLARGGTALVVRCFSFAAFDTTINLLANGTVLLADHPDTRATLADDPSLLPGAIAEMLRLESPTQMIPRTLATDVQLHRQTLAAGDEALLLIGAAHRDDRHFDNPGNFDLKRDPRNHIAFGSGIHTCVGRHLARLEASIYFRQLLERFPGFRINSRRYKASGWSRSFAEVELSCT
jgi:cytochrome P450